MDAAPRAVVVTEELGAFARCGARMWSVMAGPLTMEWDEADAKHA